MGLQDTARFAVVPARLSPSICTWIDMVMSPIVNLMILISSDLSPQIFTLEF